MDAHPIRTVRSSLFATTLNKEIAGELDRRCRCRALPRFGPAGRALLSCQRVESGHDVKEFFIYGTLSKTIE